MKQKKSQRFHASLTTRWVIPAIMLLLGATLLFTIVLVFFSLMH